MEVESATALFLSANSLKRTIHATIRAICSISSTVLTPANFFSPQSTPRNAEYTPENTSAGSMMITSVIDSDSAKSAPMGLLKSSTIPHTESATISSNISAAEHTEPLLALSFAVSLDTTSGTPDVSSVSRTKKND